MDKVRIPNPSNGFPINWEDIEFALGLGVYTKGIIQALEGILKAYGNNLIVSGCGVSGSNIAEGWVLIEGELIKVDAHTATGNYFEKVVTYNATGNKQTQTGGSEDSYQQNRATATASSGTLESPVSGNPSYLPKEKILELIRTDSDFESSTTNKGVIEKATPTEAQNRAVGKNITADNLPDVIGELITRPQIDIGDWNMHTSLGGVSEITISDAWVIANFDKVRSISAVIRNDTDTNRLDFATSAGSGNAVRLEVNNTGIVLKIDGSSIFFGSTNYNSTSYNRGWVTIEYLP